jgi:hypothetical protein
MRDRKLSVSLCVFILPLSSGQHHSNFLPARISNTLVVDTNGGIIWKPLGCVCDGCPDVSLLNHKPLFFGRKLLASFRYATQCPSSTGTYTITVTAGI